MYNTIKQTVYWPGLEQQCNSLCARYKACQLSKKLKQKYSILPPKNEDLTPWHTVCVDCMGPFTIKVKGKGRILIEEFGPKIVYIKGNDNTIANAMSRLSMEGEMPSYTNKHQ